MTTNWQLDKDYLRKVIETGIEKLNDPTLSKSKKSLIKYDIETFKRFLQDDYENRDTYSTNFPKNIEKLKEYILTKMQRQYKTLGEDLIRWIIKLSQTNIFESQISSHSTQLSIEEQAELTLKTYENNSKKLLIPARTIILNNQINQIQQALSLETSSYCHHDDITNLPYLIINPTEAPWILNHEVEHGVEGLLNYKKHDLYTELGPHFFELLFLDELYKKQNNIASGDYQARIDDAAYFLKTLSSYFKIMLLFASVNFNVPTTIFIDTFIENQHIYENNLIEYLKEEIATDEQVNNMCYLFSFLKAIELREKNKKVGDSIDLLEPYITTQKFIFSIPQDNFKPYQRYISEQKQKTYSKK